MPSLLHPPIPQAPTQQTRRVGVELEYGTLPLDATAQLIQAKLGGEWQVHNAFYHQVLGTELGDFKLEIDSRLLTEKAYEQPLRELGLDLKGTQVGDQTLEKVLEQLMGQTASQLVPYEIAAPPLPYDQLPRLDELRQALHEAGAEGTRGSLAFAFGLHLNPELPDHSAASVLAHLRAFLILYPWLLREGQVDLTRRFSPFIDPFPQDYIDLLFDADYQPDGPQLVADYHQHNPDRNRPLDCYPLFTELWPEATQPLEAEIGKLNPRPTYHYRLPNCDIDRDDWSLLDEWNRWVAVEQLAQASAQLKDLMAAHQRQQADTWFNFSQQWHQYLTEHYFTT